MGRLPGSDARGRAQVRRGPRGHLCNDNRNRRESGRRMSLVFAGICSHAPGITGRAHLADPAAKDAFHAAFYAMGDELRAARPDALIVIGAEHFGNFFMNNMPAFAISMADGYEG